MGMFTISEKVFLRCAFAKFMMDKNGTAMKNLRECKRKPGARRPCAHLVTQNMESLITLWRVKRLSLCRLRMFDHIADFNKGTVKKVYDYFKADFYPDLEVDFDILYDKQEASFKYLRRQTLKPWNSADDLDLEMRRLMVDVPRYNALYDAYLVMLGNEMAVRAIVDPIPVVPIEEGGGVAEARAAVQEVVNARHQGVVGQIYYVSTLESGQVVRRRL